MGFIFLLFGVVLILIGAAFIVLTRFAEQKQAELEARCTVPTDARLVDHVRRSERYTDEIRVTYHGVYEYLAEGGLQVRSENENGYGRPENISGPTVAILYNPDDPTEFLIPEEHVSISSALPGLRSIGPVLLALGVPLLVAAVAFWGA